MIVDSGQLPVGWQVKILGEVCTLQRGFDLPKEQREEGDYLLISSSGCIDTHTEAKVLSPGVVTGRSGSIGSVFFITEDFWPLNTTLYVKDFHRNDPRFIFYLLDKFDLKRFASGVGVPTLNRNNVHSELVIIPSSITEQKRIVTILDEVFEGCDRAIRNTENNLANAREIFESYLNDIFTQKGKGWVERKLEEISECVSVGHVGETSSFYCDENDGIPFVRSQNVRPRRLELDGVRYITKKFHAKLKKSRLISGDLLFVRVGVNRGDCCSVPANLGELNCANIVFARPREGLIDYLEYYCQSKTGRSQLMRMTTGSAQGVINTKSVAELLIPFPHID